jgi:hypothetical protein
MSFLGIKANGGAVAGGYGGAKIVEQTVTINVIPDN